MHHCLAVAIIATHQAKQPDIRSYAERPYRGDVRLSAKWLGKGGTIFCRITPNMPGGPATDSSIEKIYNHSHGVILKLFVDSTKRSRSVVLNPNGEGGACVGGALTWVGHDLLLAFSMCYGKWDHCFIYRIDRNLKPHAILSRNTQYEPARWLPSDLLNADYSHLAQGRLVEYTPSQYVKPWPKGFADPWGFVYEVWHYRHGRLYGDGVRYPGLNKVAKR